jgi:purine-cytosine permease-like protein
MKLPTTLNNWAGATGFVVALFLSAGWAAAMIAAALDDDVSDAGIQLLTGLGGVLAGAVAGYLGAGAALLWQTRHQDEQDEDA